MWEWSASLKFFLYYDLEQGTERLGYYVNYSTLDIFLQFPLCYFYIE